MYQQVLGFHRPSKIFCRTFFTGKADAYTGAGKSFMEATKTISLNLSTNKQIFSNSIF
jgi:hypothetical protein